MFNKNIKLGIAVGILSWAIYEFSKGHIGNGIALIFLASIFIFLYFKNEFILLAFLKLRTQNFEKATKWLDYIKNPESALIKSQQAYFYYMHGLMLSQVSMTKAEKNLKKAIKLGLKKNHDLAMAKLQLAGIAMTKRRKREATTLMNEAKKLDKYDMLKEQIKMMKKQMSKI